MGTKTAAPKPPAKQVMKKKGSRKPVAAQRLPKLSPKKTTREADAALPDSDPSVDAAAPHERVEPRELSHERLSNLPEETDTPAPDEDLVDDVAADAEALEGRAAEEYDDT